MDELFFMFSVLTVTVLGVLIFMEVWNIFRSKKLDKQAKQFTNDYNYETKLSTDLTGIKDPVVFTDDLPSNDKWGWEMLDTADTAPIEVKPAKKVKKAPPKKKGRKTKRPKKD